MSECFAVALGAIGFGLLAFKAGVLLVACALENGPKPTLTDAEREAVENCIYASERIGHDWSDKQAATLRALLERLNGDT